MTLQLSRLLLITACLAVSITAVSTHQHDKRVLCDVLCPKPTTTTTTVAVTISPSPKASLAKLSPPAEKNGTKNKRILCGALGCPATVTKTVTTRVTPTPSCKPPTTLPPFECITDAYLVRGAELFQANIETGQSKVLIESLGGGAFPFDAIGYNPLDNYLYGAQFTNIVRIGSDGSVETLLQSDRPVELGDVDEDGQFYYNYAGGSWGVFDLDPCSPTYGKLMGQGFSRSRESLPFPGPFDWAATPAFPGYLYAVGVDQNRVPHIARWSKQSHEWETVDHDFGPTDLRFSSVKAVLATSDGILYAFDDADGAITQFPLFNLSQASKVANTQVEGVPDAARCIPLFDK